MTTDNSKQIFLMIGGFLKDYKTNNYLRQMVNHDLAAMILREVEVDNRKFLKLEIVDVEQVEANKRKYLLVIEFPDDLDEEDTNDAAFDLAIYLAIRLDHFLTRRRGNQSRSAKSRSESARKAVQERWKRYRAQKLEG